MYDPSEILSELGDLPRTLAATGKTPFEPGAHSRFLVFLI